MIWPMGPGNNDIYKLRIERSPLVYDQHVKRLFMLRPIKVLYISSSR